MEGEKPGFTGRHPAVACCFLQPCPKCGIYYFLCVYCYVVYVSMPARPKRRRVTILFKSFLEKHRELFTDLLLLATAQVLEPLPVFVDAIFRQRFLLGLVN